MTISGFTTFLNDNFSNLLLISHINPYRNLEARIGDIAHRKFKGRLSIQDRSDLQKAFNLAHSWTWPAGRMKKLLATLSQETIKDFMLNSLSSEGEKDFAHFLNSCCSVLNDKVLLGLSGFRTNEVANLSFNIHSLTKSTALKNVLEKEFRARLEEFMVEVKYIFHQICGVMISLTGINEVTREKKGRWHSREEKLSSYEANDKYEMYLKIIGYPATLFGIIYSYVEFTSPAIFLTLLTIVSVLAFAALYNLYWKPCPIDQPGLKNLSIDLLNEKDPIYPRKDILKKIEAAFQAKKGVILVGAPGAGKSWIARSFAQQVAANKICPFLKSPQVFSGNASSLGSYGEGASFADLEENFKNYRNQVVFFFDEFHSLFKDTKKFQNASGELIKTFCEDFKYVIGATTTDEYNQFIKNQPAIDERRFTIIHVNAMEPEQIKIALSNHLESQNLKLNFNSEVFDYIISKAKQFNPKTSNVDAAYSLLNCAIQKMSSLRHHEQEDLIVNLEDQLSLIEQKLINGEAANDLSKMKELTIQLQNKKNEISLVKNELEQKKGREQKMQKMEAYLQKLKLQSYRLAKPDFNLSWDSSLTREWNELHVHIRIVSEHIAKERLALGLPQCLNKELIDNILKERSKN